MLDVVHSHPDGDVWVRLLLMTIIHPYWLSSGPSFPDVKYEVVYEYFHVLWITRASLLGNDVAPVSNITLGGQSHEAVHTTLRPRFSHPPVLQPIPRNLYLKHGRLLRIDLFPCSFGICLPGVREKDGHNIGRTPTCSATPGLPLRRIHDRSRPGPSIGFQRIPRKE